MKRIPPSEGDHRFRAHVRHYHRATSSRKAASWREWVEGSEAEEQGSGLRLKVVLTMVVLAAAVALVAGLVHVGLA